MPCNMIATVKTKLSVSLGLVIGTDAGLNAAKVVIAAAAGVEAASIKIYKTDSAVTFTFGGWNETTVQIFKTGEIVVRTGQRLEANVLKEKLSKSLTALAGLIAQARAVAAIGAKTQVVSQERAANGAIVMTVEV